MFNMLEDINNKLLLDLNVISKPFSTFPIDKILLISTFPIYNILLNSLRTKKHQERILKRLSSGY